MEIKIIDHRARQWRKHNHQHQGVCKNYGEVWFDTRTITNILSLKNVKNKYRVTYDNKSEDVFTVHMNKGRIMQFKMHEDGLH